MTLRSASIDVHSCQLNTAVTKLGKEHVTSSRGCVIKPNATEGLLLSFICAGTGVDVKMSDGFSGVKEVLLLFRHFCVFLFVTVIDLSCQIRGVANFGTFTTNRTLLDLSYL